MGAMLARTSFAESVALRRRVDSVRESKMAKNIAQPQRAGFGGAFAHYSCCLPS